MNQTIDNEIEILEEEFRNLTDSALSNVRRAEIQCELDDLRKGEDNE